MKKTGSRRIEESFCSSAAKGLLIKGLTRDYDGRRTFTYSQDAMIFQRSFIEDVAQYENPGAIKLRMSFNSSIIFSKLR